MKFVIIIITTLFLISGCGDVNQELNKENKEEITTEIQVSWEERLYTPTYFTKIDDYYFIVDCWHHRIIYSKNLNLPISDWKVLDDVNLAGPHSIVSDGELLVVDNTGYHRVNVYKKNKSGEFELQQEIDDIGNRPHRVIYSPEKKGFYVLGSVSTDIYFFKNINGKLHLEFTKKLDFLGEKYTRSFRIIDDKMYFVSGNNKIVAVNYLDNSFNILEDYDVPDELAGMNDIYKIDDYFYITATPQKFIRTNDLSGLKEGMYEDLYSQLDLKGTPYYFEKIDDFIYMPEITEHSSLIRFKVEDDKITNFERIHDFGLPSEESEIRKSEFPT